MSLSNDGTTDLVGSVVWSEWSQWSTCVDKNGICDPIRHHSRLRTCVVQHTGDKVDVSQCRQRFNLQDKDIEVADCSQTCSQQQKSLSNIEQQLSPSNIMSDAPSIVNPQTAPSVMLTGNEPLLSPFGPFAPLPASLSSFGLGKQQQQPIPIPIPIPIQGSTSSSVIQAASSSVNSGQTQGSQQSHSSAQMMGSSSSSSSIHDSSDILTSGFISEPAQSTSSSSSQISSSTTTERSTNELGPLTSSSSSSGSSLLATQGGVQSSISGQVMLEPQVSCSNCTSDEICLLLMQQKVPFCAKIKDRSDERGCGGWCKAKSQLCQPVGQNAFKCIHDSECLPDEWRCHDGGCIPLSKRCDGHSNCYDSSDERSCPGASI